MWDLTVTQDPKKRKEKVMHWPKMMPSLRRPKSTYPFGFWNLKTNIIFQKNVNFKKRKTLAMRGGEMMPSRRRPKSTYFSGFYISTNFELLQKSCEFQKRRDSAAAGTRNGVAPDAAKIDLPSWFFFLFYHVLVAQLADRVIFTPVASGPHIPRPKDCPGLGYPNTLKLWLIHEFKCIWTYDMLCRVDMHVHIL